MDLCNTSVVKIDNSRPTSVDAGLPVDGTFSPEPAVSPSARRVAQAIMSLGPSSAAVLAGHVEASVAAVNKHLDALESAGWVSGGERGLFGPAARQSISRGRGRPARVWSLTDAGVESIAQRASGHDECAVVAAAALNRVRLLGGEAAVRDVAQDYADGLTTQWREAQVKEPAALASILAKQGYAAVAVQSSDGAVQLLQHHCPLADVAAANPQFCEAETSAISDVLGRNVVRLSTIAAGGALCTTLVPTSRPSNPSNELKAPQPIQSNGDPR